MRKIVLVNLLVFAAGVLACELIFGSWFAQHSYGFLSLPRDVQILSSVEGLYEGGGSIAYSRDQHGLRGNYGAPEDIDLLVLGGSTTNELYIDDCCTWTNLLSDLARQGGHQLDVANAGVDGQSSVGHIWNFEMWFPNIPDLRPRFVLIYLGINERNARTELRTNKGMPQYTDPGRRAKQYIKNNSALFNLYKTVRGTIEARGENLWHGRLDYQSVEWQPMPLSDFQARACDAQDLNAYVGRLRLLDEKIRVLGARPIFATQTRGDSYVEGDTIYGVDGTNALGKARELDCINQATLSFCKAGGDLCIDVASRAELAPGDFYDAIHTAPGGSAKVARVIYEQLESLL